MKTIGALLCLLSVLQPFFAFANEDKKTSEPRFFYDAALRGRYEFADWFGALPAGRHYSYGHTKALLGAGYGTDSLKGYLQGEYFQLYNLPRGAAGPGAAYFGANGEDEDPGEAALRQAYAELKEGGFSAQAGRFLYSNGSEAPPKNARLAALRAARVSQRIIGPFDFTAGRSFDGGKLVAPAGSGALGALFAMPTQGGFEANLNRTIDEIKLGALSWTAPYAFDAGAQSDAQLFTYFYGDDRSALKTDNRPLEARTADTGDIEIATFGAHWAQLLSSGAYPLDALVWSAAQAGDWGGQDHRALAFTAELGGSAQQLPWRPGMRAGYTYGSGDNDPGDGDHTTFFQMLPTARAFAATPFYNMQNISDYFIEGSVLPAEPVRVKTSLHFLQLNESRDLHYFGGGANEQRGGFGYGGVPSRGSHDVGALLDLESVWRINEQLSLTLYYGHLFGGDAVSGAAPGVGKEIDYFFAEFNFKMGSK